MNKTYIPKVKDLKKVWHLVDAKDKILGRLAVRVAVILRGKNKPYFTPHMDTGDGVIVINAAKIRVTGRKLEQKTYQRYSGYHGGQKEIPMAEMLKNKPETVFKLAVKRMLPKGSLGNKIFKKLKVYSGPEHTHAGQKPKAIKL